MIESIPSKDGKSKYSSTSKYLLFDTNEQVIGIYGVGHDITSTIEEKSKQEFIINNIPGGIATFEGKYSDVDSLRLSYFSDGFVKLFGYTREEYDEFNKVNPLGLIEPEYVNEFKKELIELITHGTQVDYLFRITTKDNIKKWIHCRAVLIDNNVENMSINAILLDVTQRQEILENLRISEEENRLALQHCKNVVCRFDIAKRTLNVSPKVNPIFNIDGAFIDVPYGQIKSKKISEETADVYREFYENIINGGKNGSVIYQRLSSEGFRWIEAHSSTIFSENGKPVSAVISFIDITDDYEKEIAYNKWLQTLHNKDPKTYSLYRGNLNSMIVFDTVEGELLDYEIHPEAHNFEYHTNEYTNKFVWKEDYQIYKDFLNTDKLLERYKKGDRILNLEYREKITEETYRWLRLTIDMVEYLHTGEVEIYLLYENIDEEKREEINTKLKTEIDFLTKILNRNAFIEKFKEIVKQSESTAKHALLMADIDGFKLVNDVFGHSVGDQVLIETANQLQSTFEKEGIVGRIGGDEFVLFFDNISDERFAVKKAKQVCELIKKSLSAEISISTSIGITIFPQDGTDFDTLYKKADEAMYYVKGSGGNNFAIYREDMKDEHLKLEEEICSKGIRKQNQNQKKKRMLIVDDNQIDNRILSNIFENDYIIEKAKSGTTALIRLRHYGSAISVVLLDLMMPDLDGFAVLKEMQQSSELRNIPVVVVSASDDRQTSLKAIRCGASDFVMKPVDSEELMIRVSSVISKAENESLRIKNNILELQNEETLCYKTVLDKIGLVVTEYNCETSIFTYSSSMIEYLYGRYDNRSLWEIFQVDSVATNETIDNLKKVMNSLIKDKHKTEVKTTVLLKSVSGILKSFNINMYKLIDAKGFSDRIIITFNSK